MPTLIACLSSGKGTWAEVGQVIRAQPWTKVYLVTDPFGKEKFQAGANVEFVVLNLVLEATALVQQIKKELQGKITDFEVGVNLASGTGKEHMAVLEAVMELGLNFRLVTVDKGQIVTLGLER